MAHTQEDLIREEQKILDELIGDMDQALMRLDKRLTYEKVQAKKAKEACLPDAYGMLVSAEHDKIVARQKMRELYNGKDELYETRLVLDVTDERGTEREEVKIGLHTYLLGADIFITSWKMPLCRHYILDNSAEEYDGVVIGKHGEKYETHYQLRLKRQIKMYFDKVKGVTHFFPIDEEAEQIIADEFLQELLKRRSGQEFKNIVFSIQKKQGEIIQTPFKQNLIVQGCAGSGKSMIMLHRLPIVLYDNPNSLDRNNLYIITPSIAYIQMANNMRMDLEIEDLKMGTLEQYYNHVIEKYNCNPENYGTIKPYIKLSEENLQYIYSAECVADIKARIEEIIHAGTVDYKSGYMLLALKEEATTRVVKTPADTVHVENVRIQRLINANDKILRLYHRKIFDLLAQLEECARMLDNRKVAISRSIAKLISAEEKTIDEKQKEIRKIENAEEHQIMIQNRLNAIKAAEKTIIDLKETQEIVDLDDAYFEKLKELAKRIRQLSSLFSVIKSERMNMKISEQYEIIEKKECLCESCGEILKEIRLLGDPYWEYVDGIEAQSKKVEPCFFDLQTLQDMYLSLEYLQQLQEVQTYLEDVAENSVQNIYLSFMKKLGQEPDEKGRLEALECSPYLYLQILFQFKGIPGTARESLITIDEAQNIAPEELRLIKAVNSNNVVLNLFGDVKQHVEGSKGIDDWKEIAQIASFKKEYMQENYRNARQITSYCNKRFKLNMRAINLDGSGVHEVKDKDSFEVAFASIFQKPQNVGLSCIIVKNRAEAETLLEKAGNYRARIHNMTGELVEIQKNKWNLMTAEQAKGLEFETVFAISGRMSENEKYIAYTRALDELYVYDGEIDLIEISAEDTNNPKAEKRTKVETTRKKRVKRSSKEKSSTSSEMN